MWFSIIFITVSVVSITIIILARGIKMLIFIIPTVILEAGCVWSWHNYHRHVEYLTLASLDWGVLAFGMGLFALFGIVFSIFVDPYTCTLFGGSVGPSEESSSDSSSCDTVTCAHCGSETSQGTCDHCHTDPSGYTY